MNHIIIGQRNDWGHESLAGMPPEEARHHTYLIGQTGSGKTSLLRNLILQHLEAGHGLALIDPHGDLAEELLDLFPPHRANDLVYFNPADLDFPVSVNPLPRVAPDERHRVASGVTAAFKSLWRDSWGPRLEYLLYNSLQALLECPNTSLLGVNRLLSDPVYRQWVIRQVRDPFVRSFWTNEFERYDERFLREAIAPVQNKIGQLLMSPPVRNVLGQVRTRVDFRFLMDTGRVFIANLSKGRLGEDNARGVSKLLKGVDLGGRCLWTGCSCLRRTDSMSPLGFNTAGEIGAFGGLRGFVVWPDTEQKDGHKCYGLGESGRVVVAVKDYLECC